MNAVYHLPPKPIPVQLPLFPEKQIKEKSSLPCITLTCETCNQEFQRELYIHKRNLRLGTQHIYCSHVCNTSRSKDWPESIAEEYLQGATLTELAKKYNATPGGVRFYLIRIGIEVRKCGKESHLKPYRKPPNVGGKTGSTRPEKTKQKMREAATERFNNPEERIAQRDRTYKRISEGKIARVSKLEDTVAQELERLDISFTRQYPVHVKGVEGCVALLDFMLADGRGIEVNGTYWHADPRRYPDGPISHSQKKVAEKYNRKMVKLAELGIPVIELWEIDLNADMPGTIQRALATHVAPPSERAVS